MTLKQLWLATGTVVLVAAFSRPDALTEIVHYSAEAAVWALSGMLEHLMSRTLGH